MTWRSGFGAAKNAITSDIAANSPAFIDAPSFLDALGRQAHFCTNDDPKGWRIIGFEIRPPPVCSTIAMPAPATSIASDVSSTLPQSTDSRGRLGRVMGVQMLGTGSYVPENLVTNEDLAALGCDSDWIIRRTGIRQRYHATEGTSTGDLCDHAARAAIEAAGVSASDIDLILVATITPDHITPSTACHLQRRLGAVAPAMDISAACAGFVYAMVTASSFIASGNSKCALVVGADLMSRTIDPEDKRTYPLFGDGAGAVILGSDPSKEKGLLSYQLGSEGCGGEMLCIPSGGTRQPFNAETLTDGSRYLKMDGRNVFKWAVRLVDESAKEVMGHAGVDASQLDHIILHQANRRIIDSAVSDLGVDESKVYMNLDRYGNTSGASIPLAIDEMTRQGKLQPGDKALLCGFGSGLAWGTAVVQF